MRQRYSAFVLLLCAATVFGSVAQQGNMGNSGRASYQEKMRRINDQINGYLDSERLRSILTPGEFNEWQIKMTAGQVLVADASSSAFDPGLEVVDDHQNVLAKNDDRFLGDQDPLLFWRCTKDGDYSLHVVAYHGKGGGEVFVRFKVYHCVDISDKTTEIDLSKEHTYLLHMSIQSGQVVQILTPHSYINLRTVIAPGGLPDIGLAGPLQPVMPNTVMAPVAGDYYALADLGADNDRAHIGTRTVAPQEITLKDDKGEGQGTVGTSKLWSMDVKKGQLLQLALPKLSFQSRLVVFERPDVSKYALDKDDSNPFMPHDGDIVPNQGPAYNGLPARARDSRYAVFVANRDATLWIAGDSAGTGKDYSIQVTPAAADFPTPATQRAKLPIGNNDYWAYQASVGDVIAFTSQAADFAEHLKVYEPGWQTAYDDQANPDEGSLSGNVIVRQPGRYVMAVSAIGDGGGGGYTVQRSVIHAKDFSVSVPAEGDFSDHKIHVWKLAVKAAQPLLLQWKSSAFNYGFTVLDQDGHDVDLDLRDVGAQRYAILNVNRDTTLILVLLPNGNDNAQYSISVQPLPGFKK